MTKSNFKKKSVMTSSPLRHRN